MHRSSTPRPLRHDENIAHYTYINDQSEKTDKSLPLGQAEVIKLRDLNLSSRNFDSQGIIDQDTLELVKYLRRPEHAAIPKKRWRRFPLESPTIEGLGEINSEFIPESPSLERTLAGTSNCSTESKLLKMCDGTKLDLSSVSKFYDRNFDCQPFFHTYDYQNRLEPEDYASILSKIVEDEVNKTRPTFEKELEFKELKKLVKKYDYIMYYTMGIDKLGYFKLKKERDLFKEYSWKSYTCPLKYDGEDDESLTKKSRTSDEEIENSNEHDDEQEVHNISNDDLSVMSLDVYV